MGLTLKMFKAGDCHLVCDDGHMFFFHLSETCNGSFFNAVSKSSLGGSLLATCLLLLEHMILPERAWCP